MTTALIGEQIAKEITEVFPDAVVAADKAAVVVTSKSLYQVAEFLKNAPALDFDYLTNLTAVDYVDYFEVVYHLISLKHNHSLVLKTRCHDRDKPVVPSVVNLWRSADFQEREAYDLMGIIFDGHPNLKRLLLWEGFVGHPLRRDYL
ncbi:MAG: NADH-quinone oxidoreductase subunit C [Chloroflexi bacterium]|jgi:NADH/F420H2 dehydrogenase subunit C|nr:NADH-quinone oxidoreductase subunit C [Chloroflexota bacterium]